MSLLKKGGAIKSTGLPQSASDELDAAVELPNYIASGGTGFPIPPPIPLPQAVVGHDDDAAAHSTHGLQLLPDGTVLQGRYAIESVLGVGGMSLVYRGRDRRFKDVVRACAIKEMFQNAPDSGTRSLMLKNFEREASLLATLSHPAIPKVFDFFDENGKVYLVMEMILGQDLETTLDQAGGPLPEAQVVEWAVQLCDVVEYLHRHEPQPIIFRDMKPSNVIITPDERIVLIDFGIARIFLGDYRKGTMIGTEGYAPPEQYRGIADRRGDVYALGATLHHLLTNSDPRTETPFTFHERPMRQLNPLVSPELEAVVARALHYDPEQRPQTMGEFKALLLQTPMLRQRSAPTAIAGSNLHITLDAGTTYMPALVQAAGSHIPELAWKFACEDEVRSSPLVRDGMVYIGSYDTNLYCLDAENGAFRWKRATQGGVSSSPAAWGDLIVVGSEDGGMYALDARRGVVKWVFRTTRAIRSSPRVEDRIIYVGSDDQHVYAIDGQNGRQLWKQRTWMPVRSSCALRNGALYVGSADSNVYAFDAFSGGLRWKQKTQQGIVSSPVVGDNLVFIGSMDGYIYALDTEGGSTMWRYKTNHYVNASPCLHGLQVFAGSVDGCMYALEWKTGKLVWKYDTGSQITSSARVHDGKLYFGAADHAMYCLGAADGSLCWKYETRGPIVSSPAIADGLLIVGSLDHRVYALKV